MKVAVCGLGKAGKELIKYMREQPDIKLVAAFCRMYSINKGKDIGDIIGSKCTGITAIEINDAEAVLLQTKADVVIDFSTPAASKKLVNICKKHGIPIVICTTGFAPDDLEWLRQQGKSGDFGIIHAPNVTMGINVLLSAIAHIAEELPDYDYQITETHHSKKMDIPSGTAKKIARVLCDALPPEKGKVIPIHSVRAGGYIGIHEVLVVGENERITITHESFSRKAFVEGAVHAARYIQDKKGWHEMADVIRQH